MMKVSMLRLLEKFDQQELTASRLSFLLLQVML